MIIRPIIDIAEICARQDISQAVICPGSRSAALTLAFARHDDIQTFVIPDERSAGYIALGLAQSSQRTVAIICTSGTAAVNLYPAIIEAFYQQIPLLVLTADRPPEWTDQLDGQTIRQQNIFHNHVLASFQFPVSFEHKDAIWHAHRIVNEAILLTKRAVSGPAHINVPIREPFYPKVGEPWKCSEEIKLISRTSGEVQMTDKGLAIFDNLFTKSNHNKVLVVVGQCQLSNSHIEVLRTIQERFSWVVIGDITSNLHKLDGAITKHDLLLLNHDVQADLAPDLLITVGKSTLSKGLKGFLRRCQPQDHWHIGEEDNLADTFKGLTNSISLNTETFFTALLNSTSESFPVQTEYISLWNKLQKKAIERFTDFLNTVENGEFQAVKRVLDYLPDDCDLHLANSMSVRYASYIGILNKSHISVWSNRGASGIDGCTSTAVGHSINSRRLQILITGDLAFFYDRNGLWHNYLPENFRIIVLNNHGGGIFRLIDGPKQQPELEEFFETSQKLNAENTAKDFNFKYFNTSAISGLGKLLEDFFSMDTGKAILEIETDQSVNQEVFERFKSYFRN